ncbi:tripartite motif-containing protein 2 [Trichonephila clavata]|uniref:Tripartite motif-containing protein 2 n=1 Tax=Trichonephila clavata TaxID=2740835 RepID=A0A8X6LNW7_TRICU|nr:tripartite motif-containing protein 2 [Trichonephila clavata]
MPVVKFAENAQMASPCVTFIYKRCCFKRKMTSSTLVETVSIDYEDFSESFLTCGTCLCTYDGQEHTPKLLPCSHTVCRSCLERIAAGNGVRDAGSFRCPICRETIPLPRGGVNALPPSFLVNQLLDLMSRQRREVIPKCSLHSTQELLFCETCDCVFCRVCTTGAHGNGTESGQHTVIPFSIAIKRMSEILLYKAHLCISKLNRAAENVNDEISKLDTTAEETFEAINRSVQEITAVLEQRRSELIEMVKKLRNNKKKILEDQLSIIESEKEKVQLQCNGLQYQVEVRNITNRISDLNKKLDSLNAVMEPRENAFLKYEHEHNSASSDIEKSIREFGRVRSSTTYPALCCASVKNCAAHLETTASITTYDYHGTAQTEGGDPVVIDLRYENGDSVKTHLVDRNNGTYDVNFLPEQPGNYKLNVTIFDRPIKDSPFHFIASEHINPESQYGLRGSGELHFLQPVGIAISSCGQLFILDTGNSRIKALTNDLDFIRHISNSGMEERSGTGIALSAKNTLFIANWRTKHVAEVDFEGNAIQKFTHCDFVEPIDLAINSKGQILVADNGASSVFIFEPTGKFVSRFGKKGNENGAFNLMSSITIGPQDEIIVSDSRIQVFGASGKFIREIYPEGKGKGHHGGVVYDGKGNLLATRCEKNGSFVQVFSYQSGNLQFIIDSHDAKLKRPSGLDVTDDFHVIVVDLGNDCIKKFRYR